MKPEVIEANIEVHTRLAGVYNETEPQFRPENLAKVRAVLCRLRGECSGGKLLDIGCGTGFVINLARDLFDEVHGVDVTQAMLDRVDLTSGNVTLHNAPAETLPFSDCAFDMVTAYSFLHHTADYLDVVREVYRVMKPGGIFYVDQDPNKLFWDAMIGLGSVDGELLPSVVLKGRESVLSTEARIERQYGIPQELVRKAEYSKAILGGFEPRTIEAECLAIGFRKCSVKLDWFLGQAEVMHGQSFEIADHIERYLRQIAPLSDHLFKYIQLVCYK
jgi:ubiquinone/menaquinone biosynthesis C-methylase UbiE